MDDLDALVRRIRDYEENFVPREMLDAAIERLQAERDQARAERDALTKDAQRYRWLRERWDACTDNDIELHTDAMNADDPDAAIDAALADRTP